MSYLAEVSMIITTTFNVTNATTVKCNIKWHKVQLVFPNFFQSDNLLLRMLIPETSE
jgi:hypothetical protein